MFASVSQPSAPSPAAADSVPAAAATIAARSPLSTTSILSPTNNGTTQHCFQDANDVHVCVWEQEDAHNNTNIHIHNQNGVYDFHNTHSSQDDDAVAGKVPSTNTTAYLPPMGPPAQGSSVVSAEPPAESGTSTVFEGKKADDEEASQDIHREGNSEYEDHQSSSDHSSQDWRSQFQVPNRKGSLAVHSADDDKNESLVHSTDDGVKDVTETNSDHDAGSLEYADSNSHNNTLKVAWDHQSSEEKEEHTSPEDGGVWDFHDETDSSTTASIQLSGPAAWKTADEAYDNYASTISAVGARTPPTSAAHPMGIAKRLIDSNADGEGDWLEPGEFCRIQYKHITPPRAHQLNLQCCMTSFYGATTSLGFPVPATLNPVQDPGLMDRCVKEKRGDVTPGKLMTVDERWVFDEVGRWMQAPGWKRSVSVVKRGDVDVDVEGDGDAEIQGEIAGAEQTGPALDWAPPAASAVGKTQQPTPAVGGGHSDAYLIQEGLLSAGFYAFLIILGLGMMLICRRLERRAAELREINLRNSRQDVEKLLGEQYSDNAA
ncbi:hypothetical protein LTR85_010211 [Meristemomyces frigidus]|nr:hypothetical protein LTR85_010211 [Meristemomyces frigidus]